MKRATQISLAALAVMLCAALDASASVTLTTQVSVPENLYLRWNTGSEPRFLLHQRTLTIDRSVNIFESDSFDLDLELIAGSLFDPADRVVLFDDLHISSASGGDFFRAHGGNDPAFASAAARLTNNADELLLLVLTENATQRSELRGLRESDFFQFGGDAPDLAGKQIDAIELSISSFSLASSGSGDVPPVQLLATISIYGVPEPGSAALLLAGVAGTVAATRRRR